MCQRFVWPTAVELARSAPDRSTAKIANLLMRLWKCRGEAEKAGMKMRPTKLLIFGSPKGGTPVMLAAPSIAIDLPLKVLVGRIAVGRTWLSYNSPEYLKKRHSVPDALVKNIAGVGTLVRQVVE